MSRRGRSIPTRPTAICSPACPCRWPSSPLIRSRRSRLTTILMIVGEKGDTKFWSNEVYAKAQEPKGTVCC